MRSTSFVESSRVTFVIVSSLFNSFQLFAECSHLTAALVQHTWFPSPNAPYAIHIPWQAHRKNRSNPRCVSLDSRFKKRVDDHESVISTPLIRPPQPLSGPRASILGTMTLSRGSARTSPNGQLSHFHPNRLQQEEVLVFAGDVLRSSGGIPSRSCVYGSAQRYELIRSKDFARWCRSNPDKLKASGMFTGRLEKFADADVETQIKALAELLIERKCLINAQRKFLKVRIRIGLAPFFALRPVLPSPLTITWTAAAGPKASHQVPEKGTSGDGRGGKDV